MSDLIQRQLAYSEWLSNVSAWAIGTIVVVVSILGLVTLFKRIKQ